MTHLVALPEGTVLAGDYKIRRVLGAGGFGVTYLAEETALGRLVSIKEYFPTDFAARDDAYAAAPRSKNCTSDYTWGLDRFIEEAQTLARFNHPNIVRVYRVFRANGTAYMVLHFEEGQNLKAWLKSLGRTPRQKEIDALLPPMLDALETIHKADFLHRDLAPDNIIIRKAGDPVLIDFGAARGELAAHSKTKTVSALVKPGYSPYEQYAESSRQQGPWTDIYALSATLYHCVAGKRPPDSPSRMLNDEMPPVRTAALASYRSTFLDGIDNGLALTIGARPQSVAAWRGALLAPEPQKPGVLARMRDKTERRRSSPKKGSTARDETGIPPPPDAPGPAGGMLDFVDALKTPLPAQNAKAPKVAARQPDAAVVAKGAPVEKANARKTVKPAAISVASAPPITPTVAAKKRVRPNPDVARPSRYFRGLVSKLSFAAILIGLLIGFREEIPRVLATPPAQITTGAINPPKEKADPQISEQAHFTAHSSEIETVAFNGDGRFLVTMSDSPELKVWSTDSNALYGVITLPDGIAKSLAVRNDRAVTAHGDGTIAVYDLQTLRPVFRFKRNDAAVWSATFAGSEDRIAAASHDWQVAIWETGSQSTPANVLSGHRSAVQSVVADDSGRWLATGSADRSVKLWNMDTASLRRTYRDHSDFVTALAFSPDSRTLAAGTLDGRIKLWSQTTGRAQRTLRGHTSKITSIAFAPSGKLMASAAEDGSVRLRGLSRTRLYWSIGALEGGAKAVAFSNDGRTFVTGGRDGVVRVWALPQSQMAQRGDAP